MKVDVHIDCLFKKTKPECVFSCGATSYKKTLDETNVVALDFEIQKQDQIQIEFINKDEQDDNVVMIKKLLLDDIDIQHYIYHGSFEPIYNMDWYNKQVVKPPKVYRPCTELRHNGVWKIQVRTPVWKMIMEKWINDER